MRYPILALAVAMTCVGCSKPAQLPAATTGELTTEEDKTLYSLGSALGRNVASFDLTEAELEKVKVGFADAALHKDPKLDASTYFPKIQELQNTRIAAASEKEKKAGEEFLNKAATEDDPEDFRGKDMVGE